MGGRFFVVGLVGLVVWSIGCATPIEIPAADAGMSANDASIADSGFNNLAEPDGGAGKGDTVEAIDSGADESVGPLPDTAADAAHDATPDMVTSDAVSDVTADVKTDLSPDTISDVSADAIADAASDCDVGKIEFTQQNPDQYELYQLCIPENDLAAAAAVKSIDSTLSCSSSAGVFANCPTGQVACTAELLLTSTKAIVGKTWQQLCLLSLEAAVTKIAGGHYL